MKHYWNMIMPICLCADYVSFLSIRLELNIMTKQYGSERSHANVSLLESLLAPELYILSVKIWIVF